MAVGLGTEPDLALALLAVHAHIGVEHAATERCVHRAGLQTLGDALEAVLVGDHFEVESARLGLLRGAALDRGALKLGRATLDRVAVLCVDAAHHVGVSGAEVARDGAFAGEADGAPALAVLLLDDGEHLAQAFGPRDPIEEVALLLVVAYPVVEHPKVVVTPIQQKAEVDVAFAVVNLFDGLVLLDASGLRCRHALISIRVWEEWSRVS